MPRQDALSAKRRQRGKPVHVSMHGWATVLRDDRQIGIAESVAADRLYLRVRQGEQSGEFGVREDVRRGMVKRPYTNE